ncbi:MAG: 4-hydroxy-tetrahydrodipicolinate reductase [Proteobacteria bacterium]|nr:4-hydroxy-tetrahydrodipicolinate reductase [Pseudomonadota bacterium]
MLRLAIAGCHGRMGQALVQAITESSGVKLCGATVSPNHDLINTDIGTIAGVKPIHLKPVDDLNFIIDNFDVLIDFTTPDATLNHLRICLENGKKIVIGTTGFNAEQKTIIQEMSQEMAIVFAPNTSVGVNLCYELLKQAASIVGENADIEIIEAHHRNKVDAPSGTALKMGETICQVLNRKMDEVATYGRQGMTGKRDKKTIGFSSIRASDIVGEHTVIFALNGERIEITHKATNRGTFAHGAIRAAKWLESKREGLYSMADVLFKED